MWRSSFPTSSLQSSPILVCFQGGIWSICGGSAQAAFFTAVMSVVIRRSRDIDENRRTTTVMQTVGYSAAAAGPVVAGWVHQQVGGWSVPFAIILGVTVLMLGAATLAVRTPVAQTPG